MKQYLFDKTLDSMLDFEVARNGKVEWTVGMEWVWKGIGRTDECEFRKAGVGIWTLRSLSLLFL